MSKKTWVYIGIIVLVGLLFRIYYINFGLPHSVYADEAEISEIAIKYTYEIRYIIANKDYYELIPISFVYGTVPAYFFTAATIIFSKLNGLAGITFEKVDIYVYQRILNALISLSLIPAGALIYKKLFKDNFGAIVTASLIALNWKLIVHAHYLNVDIIVTVLLTWATCTLVRYFEKDDSDTLFTVLTGILVGLAIGTKVTAALTLPVFLYIYFLKKDLKGAIGLVLVIIATFCISNPFSLILIDRFILRVVELQLKENGLVFDSVNSNPFKYIFALIFISTPVGILLAVQGIQVALKKNFSKVHVFLLVSIGLYLLFYSTGSRRVDRWLLPILPVVMVYAGFGLSYLYNSLSKLKFTLVTIVLVISYLYFPLLLLTQFQRNTPKSASYIWARDNLEKGAFKYAVTQEGLDPLNKLPYATVLQYRVYESEGAHLSLPPNPYRYHYIFLSSRPLQNYKRKEVVNKYPNYALEWQNFEDTVIGSGNFELVKSFDLPKPNLIPLSDVYVYKNLKPSREMIFVPDSSTQELDSSL